VEPLTLEAVHEAQRARYAIELGVAALTVGKVSDERLAGLRAAMELTKPALYADGPRFEMDAYLPQYMAFHEAVVALADTAVLVDAYRRVNAPPMIINMTGGRLAESGGDREATETGYAHHRELVEAYERGDLEAVNATILTHIEFTLDITRRFMDAAGGTI
jgi:DNA-binding GntR family transcriptional regulator